MDGVGKRPLVSVFTAAHEIGAALDRAYRSLSDQTYREWEWVVADDSHGPETAEQLTRLAEAERPGRIRLLPRDTASGSIGAAKRRAASACRGAVLVELDHDDELLPQALELIAATFAAHADVDFVYSDWIDWSELPSGGKAGTYPPGWGFGFGAYASEIVGDRRVPVALAPPLTWETVRHIVSMPNHVRAWRADCYYRIGGHDPTLPVADDYELVLRTFLEGVTARIPRPLYVQYHDASGSNASRRRNAEIQRRVEELSARHREALDWRCVSLGVTPSPQTPLTVWAPLTTASAAIDVIVEAAAERGTPLVSIVVPTYRRPELLERALASIDAQTYENFEVLVVGDGCDSVDQVIEGIEDPRVRHWNLETHTGDSGASPRNYALKAMARGTLVAYLDDDNRWEPNHLESLVSLLSDADRSFAFASLRMLEETIVCRRPRHLQIDTSALLHRRFLLDRFGYWRGPAETNWAFAHDWELVSRWQGEPWAASLDPTVLYTLERSSRGEELLALVRDVAEQEHRLSLQG